MLKKNIIRFIFGTLILSSPLVSYAAQPVSQGAWAIALVKNAGWEKAGIPAKPSMNDYYDLLSGRNFINVNLRGYTARLGDTPDTFVYSINAAHSGRYHLIVYVTGNPLYFALDSVSTASSPAGSWGYQDIGTFILSRGTHTLNVTIPQGSSIRALYLSSYDSDSIVPPGGWNTYAPLDTAAEAQTLGMILHTYGQLPVSGTIPYTIKSAAGAVQCSFSTSANTIASLSLTFPGPSNGYVMIDSSVVITYSTTDNPSAPIRLKPVSLGPGMHMAYLQVQSGQMPASVIMNSLGATPEAFISLLNNHGYSTGSPNMQVSYSSAVQALTRLGQDARTVNAAYYNPGLIAPAPAPGEQAFPEVSGCGDTSGTILYKPGPVSIPDNTFIAVAPFENLTDAKSATAVISGSLQEALIESSNVWVTDWDKVSSQLVSYGFDPNIPIGMTLAKTIVSKLRVNMILYGSIVEYDYRKGPGGSYDIPSIGIDLNLLNVQTGRVLFAGSFAQTGTEGESLEDTARSLAASIFAEMAK